MAATPSAIPEPVSAAMLRLQEAYDMEQRSAEQSAVSDNRLAVAEAEARAAKEERELCVHRRRSLHSELIRMIAALYAADDQPATMLIRTDELDSGLPPTYQKTR